MRKKACKALVFSALCTVGLGLSIQSIGATTYAFGTGFCETVELPIQDENAKEDLNIRVFDKDTKNALKNVRLKIVDVISGKTVAILLSDEDGEASARLKVGTYQVVILNAPKKYKNTIGNVFVSTLIQKCSHTDIGLRKN